VELVGPLPAEIKITTTFGGAVSTNSNAPEAARALLQFLRTEEVVKVIRKQGMTPVS
jgi:molybdate transport system substrate-binding protein